MHNKAYPRSYLMVQVFKKKNSTVYYRFFEFETGFKGLKSGNIENRPGTNKTICTVAALWWKWVSAKKSSDPEFPKTEHIACKKI